MFDRITFCEECRKDVAYTETEVLLKNTLKGEIYEYAGKKAVCVECNSEVYIAEIEDFNLKSLYDAYRKKNSIITLENILEIPSKYNIGKRPLSLLLGWGEMTFSRYCDGDMPSKQYSDMLQHIYNEPDFYLSLLEENKSNLKSQKAYEGSKNTTFKLLNLSKINNNKIDDVINYLLFKCEDITPLALQKVLYYIQGFYYAFINNFLFAEDCEAWEHGPVYRDIYYRYSNYHFDPIKNNDKFDISLLTDIEKAVIDSVIQNFCCYSGKTLERFTHSEMPWIETRDGLSADVHSENIISKDKIGKYFIAVKDKFMMLSPNDIESYSHVMFERSKNC